VCCNVLQCVTVCCSVYVVCSSVLQCVSVPDDTTTTCVLKCVVVCYSVLECVAVCMLCVCCVL